MTLRTPLSFFLIFATIALDRAAATSADSCRPLFSNQEFLTPDSKSLLDRYLTDSLAGFERLRGENGLVKDAVWHRTDANGNITTKTINDLTSPTNIGLDLLIQGELAVHPRKVAAAKVRLTKLISTLESVQFHRDTGLFFSRYRTNFSTEVADHAVSSIDNFHLALALWTIHKKFPEEYFAGRAKKLFDRMNFSVYANEQNGILGGNLKYENGNWSLEPYNFDDLGSEARGFYSAGLSIRLFHDLIDEAGFMKKAVNSLTHEIKTPKKYPDLVLLALWDGAFQLYYPKVFIGEHIYSPIISNFYDAQSTLMIREGKRRNIGMPAAHAPGWSARTRDGRARTRSSYQDKDGNLIVVHSNNNDVNDTYLRTNWESIVRPYVMAMAGTSNPNYYLAELNQLENRVTGVNRMYNTGYGFMDGIRVKAPQKGQVITAQLSLNLGIQKLVPFDGSIF